MSSTSDPSTISPEVFWKVLVAANLISLAVLLLAFHSMMDIAVVPELANWFLIAGGVLTVPVVLYQRRTRALSSRQSPGLSDNVHRNSQLNRVVLACALAELPGLMGTIYYLFAREWIGTVALLFVTLVLLLRARPL